MMFSRAVYKRDVIKRDSPTSVDCPICYVFSFDTGEECRQTLGFSVVALLKSRVIRDFRCTVLDADYPTFCKSALFNQTSHCPIILMRVHSNIPGNALTVTYNTLKQSVYLTVTGKYKAHHSANPRFQYVHRLGSIPANNAKTPCILLSLYMTLQAF